MKKSNKVALIAIAKDEAPYLHEWIHHHLYMGFSPIFIGINRTTDQSKLILDKIAKKYPQVIFKEIDWIDQGCADNVAGNIQALGYSYLTNLCLEMFDDVSFSMYLDVDEYWFSLDKNTIKDYLSVAETADIYSFYWLCQEVESISFNLPFKQINFTHNPHVKSLFSLKALNSVNCFRAHIHHFNDYNLLKHVDGNGHFFDSEIMPQGFNGSFAKGRAISKEQSAYVLHRMIRSEAEYLSTVFRGRPSGQKIKGNRSGIKFTGAKPLDFELSNAYYLSLEKFIEQCDIGFELTRARADRMTFYVNVFESMTIHDLNKEFLNALKALSNCKILETYLSRLLTENTCPGMLRDLAVSCESRDLEVAYQLMNKAHELRPEGPIIQKKLAEYKEKLVNKKAQIQLMA